jgi:protocatechuate 4,5-dioxygenase alpha subunit
MRDDVSGQRLPLVCLCGLLCDEEIWLDVLEALGPRVRAKVFSFAHFSSITDMAKHVLAHAPARFAIAGHSMGGRVALEVLRMTPSRVSGIALLNTGIHPTGPHEAGTRGELVSIAREGGMSALAARWLPPMLSPPSLANDGLIDRLNRMIDRSSPDSFAAQVSALLHRPATNGVLESIRVPLLLVSGSEDTWSPPEQHAAMHALVPASTLVVIPNAGHMAPAEQPAALAAALDHWIDSINTLDSVNPLTSAAELGDRLTIMKTQTIDPQALRDIPGTIVFTAEMARKGYHLNQFCMSLMKAENRRRFKDNEHEYLQQWQLSDAQISGVLERNYSAMLNEGGNIYFLAKIGAADGLAFQDVAASMSGMSLDEYRAMMLAGGRSPGANPLVSGQR